MITINQFTDAFDRNLRVIQMQTEGLSQADTLAANAFPSELYELGGWAHSNKS